MHQYLTLDSVDTASPLCARVIPLCMSTNRPAKFSLLITTLLFWKQADAGIVLYLGASHVHPHVMAVAAKSFCRCVVSSDPDSSWGRSPYGTSVRMSLVDNINSSARV